MGSEEGGVRRSRQSALLRRQVAESAIASHGGSKRHMMALLSPRPAGLLSAKAATEQAKTERQVLPQASHRPSGALSARGREVIHGRDPTDPTTEKVDSPMLTVPTRQNIISNSKETRNKGPVEQSILPRGSMLHRGTVLPRGSIAVAMKERPRPDHPGTTDQLDGQGGRRSLMTKNRMTFVAFRQNKDAPPDVMPFVPELKIKEPEEERVKRIIKRFAFSSEGSGDEEMELYDNEEEGDSDGGIEVEGDGNDDEIEESSPPVTNGDGSSKGKKKSKLKTSKEEEEKVFLPGDEMEEGDELTYDRSAYEMYHAAQTNAPCLSFDVISDSLGDLRTEFPMTAYIVAGTQATPGKQNHVIVMKMSQLDKTMQDDEESDSDDELLDEEPDLDTTMLNHTGGVNRIRYSPIPDRHIVATWSERGKVHIWDMSQQVISVDNPATATGASHSKDVKPLFTFDGHQVEGFAMDWSRTVLGRLATGDCKKNIHLWSPVEGGTWHVDQRPYSTHTDSVEDIQWSPNEQNVFASCSVDKTIRIWDARAKPSKACMLTTHAHEADVNVISWNRNEPFIVSGGDEGVLKVWDLRQFQSGVAVAVFKHHTGPITSVEWHPTDSSVFVASGSDDQVTLWDLAVERDNDAEGKGRHLDVPPQLLFIHMGQKDIKEVHWHHQLPGVLISTAESGFNIFKTISV